MKLFKRMLKPKEVRDALFILQQLEGTPLADSLAFAQISERVRDTIIRHPEAVKRAVLMEGQSLQEVVLNLIINTCGADLASGTLHVYRGVLGQRGIAVRQLFTASQRMLVEAGNIEQEDMDAGQEVLLNQIAEAG